MECLLKCIGLSLSLCLSLPFLIDIHTNAKLTDVTVYGEPRSASMCTILCIYIYWKDGIFIIINRSIVCRWQPAINMRKKIYSNGIWENGRFWIKDKHGKWKVDAMSWADIRIIIIIVGVHVVYNEPNEKWMRGVWTMRKLRPVFSL